MLELRSHVAPELVQSSNNVGKVRKNRIGLIFNNCCFVRLFVCLFVTPKLSDAVMLPVLLKLIHLLFAEVSPGIVAESMAVRN